METFNQMIKNFMDTQQKTFGYFYGNDKLTNLPFTKEYYEVLENNIKFHNAAINYHKSIVDMMEVLRDNSNIFKLKGDKD